MMKIYLMLSYAGWIWTGVFALAFAVAWWLKRRAKSRTEGATGFEVVTADEKQH